MVMIRPGRQCTKQSALLEIFKNKLREYQDLNQWSWCCCGGGHR